jgi:hypothetical protein
MSAIAVACLLAAGGFAAPPRVAACPPPPSLSDYIRSAAVIVIGRALELKSRNVEEEGNSWVEHEVALRADTFLKQTAEVAPVNVCRVGGNDAEAFLASPDVPALVFLEYDEDAGGLVAAQVRVLADFTAERVFAARVREMLDILQISDERAQHEKFLEWCVRCIEEEPTRNDGLESMPYPAWRSSDDKDEDDGGEVWHMRLTDAQWERVMAVYFGDSSDSTALDESLSWVAGMLGERRDPRVIAYLEREVLRNADTPESAVPLMYLLADMLEWRTGSAIVGRYHEAPPDEQQNLVAEYLRLLPARVEYPSEPEEVEEIADDTEAVDETVEEEDVVTADELAEEELPVAADEQP